MTTQTVSYSVRPEATRDAVVAALGDKIQSISVNLGEVTVQVAAKDYLEAATTLRTAAQTSSRS